MKSFKCFYALASDTKKKIQSFYNYSAKTISRIDDIIKVIRIVVEKRFTFINQN